MTITVAPEHLSGLREIGKRFKKSRSTVKKWIAEGAPIWQDGTTYGAEYNALNDWLVKRSKKRSAA